jgi:poly(3-hydroxybutyrate) depolymerase
MKKLIYILTMFVFLAVGCENTNSETEVNDSSLTYSAASFAGHDAVIVKPSDLDVTAPLVVIVTDDLELKTRLSPTPAIPEVNFKAAEHCLIGGYTLCIVGVNDDKDVSFLATVKEAFPNASKAYLLSYCNGLAYTAAMQMPDTFAAFGCVSGAIDVETYKANNFTKPVSFVHVHATENSVYKWEGVENKSVSVPLSVGAVVAKNECITFKNTTLLQREGKGRVTCTHYTNSLSGCDVKFYTVQSDNCGWCDEEFEVYNQIWNFFNVH